MGNADRRVTLRSERQGRGSRSLWVYLDAHGSLHIDGQDLGAGTATVKSDGEYEWFKTVRSEHLPQLAESLGAATPSDIVDVLAQRYAGAASYEFEKILKESGIPVQLFIP
jgi:hypothetical protein